MDEIGDLQPAGQLKLLRLLQEHTYYALGSDREEKSNARIIMATNRELQQMIAQKEFRQDLFFRITYKIHLPPLRERLDDLPLLLNYFLEKIRIEDKLKQPLRFSPSNSRPAFFRTNNGTLRSTIYYTNV